MNTMKNRLTKIAMVGMTAGILAGCVTAETGAKSAAAKAPEQSVYAREGFHVELDKDGRLWVFKADSEEQEAFKTKGKPAKHVVRPSAGPGGVTLKAVDAETILAYMAARPGFFTQLDKDGRLWVFKAGSEELEAFKTKGKPAKHVVRPGAGPGGLTLKAVDASVLDAYQAAL